MVTLTTVLRSGGRYDRTWVERLARGARRHIDGVDRVVCLTDEAGPIDGVETIPLRHSWPKWWAKFEAFRPDIRDDINILCDLDTLFLGRADALAQGADLIAMEDYFLKGRVSTALMRWRDDTLSFLYDDFRDQAEHWMRPGSCGQVPNSVHGDQVVVDHLLRRHGQMPVFIQQACPGLLDFYGTDKANIGPVLIFIGDAKPDTADEETQRMWRGHNGFEAEHRRARGDRHPI
ncbi:hypothetical protein ACQKKX_06800 [Neorhizobium sp. NPDC001467]|uniref:hypothetical protein n=1 Tax=Neorhizobium sp. NPDC001467 TaxID=3390595 RepID=UPI003CFBC75F